MNIIKKQIIFFIVLAIIPLNVYMQTTSSQQDSADVVNQKGIVADTLSLSIGASFDFINGFKPNDIYADIGIFLPDIWSWYSNKVKKNKKHMLGLDLGLSQGQSIVIDTSEFGLNSDVIPDSILGGAVKRINNERTTNLSIYGDITYHCNKLDYIFFLAHAEFRRRDFKTEVEVEKSRPDSTATHIIKTSFSEGFFGGGFKFRYDQKNFQIEFKTVLGATVVSENRGKGGFTYLIKFKLRENIINIKFGGDIRGKGLDEPEVLIYIAKEFSFSKLTEFLIP